MDAGPGEIQRCRDLAPSPADTQMGRPTLAKATGSADLPVSPGRCSGDGDIQFQFERQGNAGIAAALHSDLTRGGLSERLGAKAVVAALLHFPCEVDLAISIFSEPVHGRPRPAMRDGLIPGRLLFFLPFLHGLPGRNDDRRFLNQQ